MNDLQLSAELALFLTKLPSEPGIYRMLDEEGTVLYVGKAANLKKEPTAILVNKIQELRHEHW